MLRLFLIFLLSTYFCFASEKHLIVYYAKWSEYHPRYPLSIPEIPADLVTDFVYAFVDTDEKGNLSVSVDEKEQLCELTKLKNEARQTGHRLITIFSVGGWEEGSEPLPALAADEKNRTHFAKEVRKFCRKYHFDGVDIDWEFPKDYEEGEHFYKLIQALHDELKVNGKDKYLITIAAPGLPEHYRLIPWEDIAPLVDRISVMTYSLHGPWKDKNNLYTNHQTALKPTIIGNPLFNISSTMAYYNKLVPATKLAVGIPLFFTTYAHVENGILPSHYGGTYSGPAKNPYVDYEDGNLFYRDIVEHIADGRAKGYWDPVAQAFMAYYPSTKVWGSGVNEEAIRRNCKFILDKGFAGAKVWQFQGDTPDWQALKLMRSLLIDRDKLSEARE